MGPEIGELVNECMRLELEIAQLLRIETLALSMGKKKLPSGLIEEAKDLGESSQAEKRRKEAEERYEKALSEVAEMLEEEGIDQAETQLTKTQFHWLKSNRRKIEDRLKMIVI